MESEDRFCWSCGSGLWANDRFCRKCGEDLDRRVPLGQERVVEPEVASKAEPEVTSKVESEVTSKAEPEVTSKVEPQVTSKAEPEVTSKAEPEVTSKVEPEVASKAEPEVKHPRIPTGTTNRPKVMMEETGYALIWHGLSGIYYRWSQKYEWDEKFVQVCTLIMSCILIISSFLIMSFFPIGVSFSVLLWIFIIYGLGLFLVIAFWKWNTIVPPLSAPTSSEAKSDDSLRQGMVSFPDAVKLGFQRYFQFKGRSTRAEFWWWVLFQWSALITVWVIDVWVLNGVFLLLILFFGLLIPYWAVLVRRLHDTNKTGWWLFLAFVPLAGIVVFVFLVQSSDMGTNKYGPTPQGAISQQP